ncbi:MAG: cytochrome c maturation protein CcmE [Actinobacteria bacterium]|nr:cytochrome c maturation protein CcmE [Actinomycetota bacterium]
MNKKAKNRLVIVTLLIVIIAVVVLAVVGSGGAAKTLTVSDALGGEYVGERVQVSGTVAEDSYVSSGNGITFDVFDPEGDAKAILHVIYEGAVPATFGDGVTAICTGTVQEDGTLLASEMITKCPSKYESAEGALTVSNLYEYGDSMIAVETKLAGYIKAGTLVAAGEGDRFVLYSQEDEISVTFDGALPTGLGDESSVVLTGALSEDGKFVATAVALEEL